MDGEKSKGRFEEGEDGISERYATMVRFQGKKKKKRWRVEELKKMKREKCVGLEFDSVCGVLL